MMVVEPQSAQSIWLNLNRPVDLDELKKLGVKSAGSAARFFLGGDWLLFWGDWDRVTAAGDSLARPELCDDRHGCEARQCQAAHDQHWRH